ncbi:hypothetical protein J4E85_007104 [Alternaria conjuncta]|uniref:uncharacterized protein n=1 Tax=Alternaria conjuncta TaxID=181017 RepID=UPI0022208871|nr:uncharacterized protein J4E85_007104 [Alternaria conjuncta]KAI4925227.1 hypothetical protein J4E85_007104 [Alternaria conjuncta]
MGMFRRFKTSGKKKSGPASEKQTEEPPEELFSTAGAYGLKTVAEGATDTVDLTGNRETTWTYKNSIFWPKDLLANDLKNVRIFTFGYDADVVKLLTTAGGNTSSRPVIFVAHSLGGLVVEQALLISRGTSQLHVKSLLTSTFGIAFMGTPHLRSRKADWAAPLTRLSSLVLKTNKAIVAVLEPASEMLSTLQQEFHTLLEDRRRNEGKWIEIFCFYEELSYAGIGDIVPRQSAILPDSAEQQIRGM